MILLFFCSQALAQTISDAQSDVQEKTQKYTIEQPHTQLYTRLNGINFGGVNAMVQSHDDYLWLGTEAGLIRFDGYDAKVYPVGINAADAAKPHVIYNVIEDDNHILWISTSRNGLYRFDPVTEQFEVYLQQLNHDKSKSVTRFRAVDRLDNRTLLVSTNKGLIQFDIETAEHHYISP
ncbi:MAG: hypothetical protein MJK04_30070, partial [Psychrosphaera sp.]|nr:hypothetical protein [Psychrosphaera sp.]